MYNLYRIGSFHPHSKLSNFLDCGYCLGTGHRKTISTTAHYLHFCSAWQFVWIPTQKFIKAMWWAQNIFVAYVQIPVASWGQWVLIEVLGTPYFILRASGASLWNLILFPSLFNNQCWNMFSSKCGKSGFFSWADTHSRRRDGCISLPSHPMCTVLSVPLRPQSSAISIIEVIVLLFCWVF